MPDTHPTARITNDDVDRYAHFIAGHPDAQVDARHLAATRAVLDALAQDGRLVPADEYAALTRRIVDEIGHPVTDEPALGPGLREQIAGLTADNTRLRQQIEPVEKHAEQVEILYNTIRRENARLRPVVKAAKAWLESLAGLVGDTTPEEDALAAAVDALDDPAEPAMRPAQSHAAGPTGSGEGQRTRHAAEGRTAGYTIRRTGTMWEAGTNHAEIGAQLLHTGHVIARLHITGDRDQVGEAYTAIRDALQHCGRCTGYGQVPYDGAAVRTDDQRHDGMPRLEAP